MEKKVKRIKLFSFLLILIEVIGITTFAVLYYAIPALNLEQFVTSDIILIALAALSFINCIYIWIISTSISSLRHKSDLKAAEVIGSDVQEAYNFAMVGLAVTDNEDNILWTNDLFKTRHIDIIDNNILDWQPSLAVLKDSSNYSGDKNAHIIVNSRTYDVKYLMEAGLWIFKDVTDFEQSEDARKKQAPVIGVLAIDNYDEVVHSEDDFNDVITKVKNKIFDYAKEYGVLLRRIKDDSYSMILDYEKYCKMHDDNFSIVDKVRKVCKELDIPLTLSIGLAREFPDVIRLNELATEALDIAMSRGGDQVVVSVYGSEMEFYGGKSEAQEKRTRVKDRVLADSIVTLVKSSSNVIIMGHSMMDLDAFGACLGFKAICDRLTIPAQIVVDLRNTEAKTRAAITSSFSKQELDKLFVLPKEAAELIEANTLLVVLDVHVPKMTMAPALLEKATKIMVIDHHRRAEEYIDSPVFNHIDPAASSTCEIISEFIRFCSLNPRIEIPPLYATFMLSGIFLDTRYFKSRKTGLKTFEACTILKDFGGDNSMADDFLKDAYEEYQLVNEIIAKLEHPAYGVVCAFASEDKIVDRATIAKAANTLLSLKGNHACFVAARVEPRKICLSARGDGTVNVSMLMEKLGGGGHFSDAAASFDKANINDVKDALLNVIEEHLDEALVDAKAKDKDDIGGDE